MYRPQYSLLFCTCGSCRGRIQVNKYQFSDGMSRLGHVGLKTVTSTALNQQHYWEIRSIKSIYCQTAADLLICHWKTITNAWNIRDKVMIDWSVIAVMPAHLPSQQETKSLKCLQCFSFKATGANSYISEKVNNTFDTFMLELMDKYTLEAGKTESSLYFFFLNIFSMC